MFGNNKKKTCTAYLIKALGTQKIQTTVDMFQDNINLNATNTLLY